MSFEHAKHSGRLEALADALEHAAVLPRSPTLRRSRGIDQDTAKKISKEIRDAGFKKVQVQIQGEELRVTSPSRDELQAVMAFLKPKDYGVELMFGNYR